ncbi:MAG TPA: hypothetical protein P5077_02690 [bacterium]|nr:hypothetical protein [bacterium]
MPRIAGIANTVEVVVRLPLEAPSEWEKTKISSGETIKIGAAVNGKIRSPRFCIIDTHDQFGVLIGEHQRIWRGSTIVTRIGNPVAVGVFTGIANAVAVPVGLAGII